ncbi:DUF4132 domain-containing protein [Rhodococcus sp. RS1C4]|nr:DUF4132 domain-containing protein [Rhodococcus sp. RS1C4]
MTIGERPWAVPPAWWRRGEAVHGRTPVARSKVRVRESSVVQGLVGDATRIGDAIRHPDTDAVSAAAGLEFLDAHSHGTAPTARAIAFAFRATIDHTNYKQSVPFVDEVIVTRGAAFAAEVIVAAAGMRVDMRSERSSRGNVLTIWVTERRDMDMLNFGVGDTHSRVRTAVAALPDDEYRRVVDVLATLRGASYSRDLSISFLLPTESSWVEEDLAAASGLPRYHEQDHMPLLACVTSARDVERILDAHRTRDDAMWSLGMRMNLVHAICANLGPGVEPLVGELFDGNLSSQNKKRCAAILAEFDTDDGFLELVERLGRKYVEPAVLAAMEAAPFRAHRLLGATAGPKAARLKLDLERLHPDLSGDRGENEPSVPQAGPVPTLLAEPPWTGDRRQARMPVLDMEAPRDALTVTWLQDERDHFAEPEPDYPMYLGRRTWSDILRPVAEGSDAYQLYEISRGPEELLRPLLADAAIPRWIFRPEADLRRLLVRFGDDAVDYVFRVVVARPTFSASVLLPVTGSSVASTMATWLGSKAMRPVALQWFDRHIDSAAPVVVVAASGKSSDARKAALAALRTLAKRGHRDALVAAATEFGSSAATAVTAFVDSDPLFDLPTRIPTLPAWLDPALLPTVTSVDRKEPLPPEAVGNICTMFALSKLDEVYAGVAVVRTLVAPGSLESLAWDLFERWSSAGCPDAQRWCLDALGIVGDDETARRLAPFVRKWPLQSAHRRAAAGLDVLAAIGTDAALGHIWAISQGLRFPALRAKADARIRQIADELALTPADLADRLIPDLGLDADGTTMFDYGSRSFTLSLDHALKIAITDSNGKTRARMPRPGPDDADEAAEEFKRYTTLRRDLDAARGELIQRFERAMVTGRRWTYGQVRRHLVGHPVAWQIVGRLVWSTDSGDQFAFSASRNAVRRDGSDPSIDDADDVFVIHPVAMGVEIELWRLAFADAHLVQPFEQVDRDVFRDDVSSGLAVLDNTKVATSQLLALERLGWEREEPQDKGAQISISKRVDEDTVAVILAFPGFNVASPAMWAEQKIVQAFVTNPNIGMVDASELLRDVSTLAYEPITGDEPDLQGP